VNREQSRFHLIGQPFTSDRRSTESRVAHNQLRRVLTSWKENCAALPIYSLQYSLHNFRSIGTMGKRKVMSDELVADSDGDEHPPQRAKTTSHFASKPTAQTDDNGDKYWEISKTRRVVISEFKGKKMVNIREYYEKDGKSLPGKKVAKSSLSGGRRVDMTRAFQ
jgi:hypothetical protein